jgi:hypothetical protein
MKIGAVSFSHVAGINRVAPAPAGAGLVVANGFDNVVVKKSRLNKGVLTMPGNLFCLLGNFAVDGNQAIRGR